MLSTINKYLCQIFKFKSAARGWEHILIEICILQRSLHNDRFSLRDIIGFFKDHCMCNSLHAIFNQELVSIPILVHVEITCMYLRNDVFNIECTIELLALLKFKYHFLQMIVPREDPNNNTCLLLPLFLKLKGLGDKLGG